MKIAINTFKTYCQFCLSGLLILSIMTGCSSPEEKAKNYYEKGMTLLEAGETEKAKIEFKNALQIKKNMNDAIYGLALAFEKDGDWQKVFNLVSQVVEQDPKNIKALIKLGSIYLASNKLDKAIEISNKLDAIDPNLSQILSYKATIALRSGDAKKALELANAALANDKTNTEAIVVLAAERIAEKDDKKSIEYLDQGLKVDPKNVGLHLMKISVLEAANQLDKAENIHLELIKLNPSKHDFRRALAAFYVKHKNMQNAEAELRKIVELDPKKVQAKLDLLALIRATQGQQKALDALKVYVNESPDDDELKFILAGAFQQLKMPKDAEKTLQDIADNADKKVDMLKAKGLLAAMYVTSGRQLEGDKLVEEILKEDSRNEQSLLIKSDKAMREKKYDAAIAQLRTIISDSPNSSKALIALARAHEATGSLELADEHFFKAYQASKLDPSYGRAFAKFLLRSNKAERAEKILSDMLEINKYDIETMKLLAQSKISRGDWVGAEEVAMRVKDNPATAMLADQIMGIVFKGQKNYDESINAFKRAYDAKPTEAQPLSALVRAYLTAGKDAEALALLQKLIKENPNNVAAHLLLAQVYESKGNMDLAIEAYENVTRLAPKMDIAYQALVIFYNKQGKSDKAYVTLSNGLKENPGNPNLLYVKAGLLESAGKVDEAIHIYEDLHNRYPEAELITNNLASLLSDKNDKASLNRAYELAQKIEKVESPYTKDTVGWAAYKVGKYSEAVTAIQIAVSKAPEVAIFHYHLGKAQLGMQNKIDAKKSLERALKFDKDGKLPSEEINKLLKEIG